MRLLLAVRFAAPEPVRFKPVDPGLEVILVNAKHDKKPVKAEALAQANLDGGGNADAGRAKSPLPNLKKTEDGDNIKAARRRVAELEQQQKVLAQNAKQTRTTAPKTTPQESPNPAPPTPAAPDETENSRALARAEAEINRQIEDYNKRPRKHPDHAQHARGRLCDVLQPAAEAHREHRHAQLPAAERQEAVWRTGDLHPGVPGRHASTRRKAARASSARPATRRWTRRRCASCAAPRRSARFPQNMRTTGKDDVWEIITRFKFTRDEAVQTELRGGSN